MAGKSNDDGAPSRQSKRTRRNEDEEVSEIVIENEIDADLDEFLEDNDSNPGDRRRDPLRRP